MRRISFLALVIVLFITSCQKTAMQPSSNAVANASSEDRSVTQDRTTLLCAHTWMYNRYYIGYVDPNNLGTLAYKRGGQNNTINLDNDFVTYYTDGTGVETADGIVIPNTWYFQDAAKTIIVVTNSYGVFTTSILKLTSKTFIFEYTDIYGVNRAGQYVPQN